MSSVVRPSSKTLVQFPCEFIFKAMLKNTKEAEMMVAKIVDEYAVVCEHGLSSKLSRENKYISVSCKAYLEDEDQLISIYQALRTHPNILMTL